MKMYTKLFIAGVIFLLLPIKGITMFSLFCFAGGFILLICKGITEITNKNNEPKQNYTYTYNTGKPNYTNETRRASDSVTPKQKKDIKPPWEE